MKKTITLNIEKLPEGVFLATSTDIPGLVVQGKTITETLDSACEVAQAMIELQAEHNQKNHPPANKVIPKMPLHIPLLVAAA